MLDDPRETFGAALKLMGGSLNATDDARATRGPSGCSIGQKPLVGIYDSANFDVKLLSGDVWLAQGWNGQFAKIRDKDPDIEYVIPKEGSTPLHRHPGDPRLRPPPGAGPRLPRLHDGAGDRGRDLPDHALPHAQPRGPPAPPSRDPRTTRWASLPTPTSRARSSCSDLGEATLLYDRMWTEVKSRR